MTLSIVANGKARDVEAGATIADLLAEKGWKPEQVVVEYNGEPLHRARYREVRLHEGDRLEIVRAVAGG
jgi:sulfur carrier protein